MSGDSALLMQMFLFSQGNHQGNAFTFQGFNNSDDLTSEKHRLLHKATSQGYNIIYCIVKERNLKGKLIKPTGFISDAANDW